MAEVRTHAEYKDRPFGAGKSSDFGGRPGRIVKPSRHLQDAPVQKGATGPEAARGLASAELNKPTSSRGATTISCNAQAPLCYFSSHDPVGMPEALRRVLPLS